jgi:hypothetical protein
MKTRLTRRAALQAALMLPLGALHAQTPPPPAGPFTLAPLPYAPEALEPHIDAMTMGIHHGKHHQAYVNNLNTALAKYPKLATSTSAEALLRNLNRLPEDIRAAVKNNGGGHVNHTIFWGLMKPGGGGAPTGPETFRQRLGLALGAQGQDRAIFLRQPGNVVLRWRLPGAGQRCVGACVLPEVPEPPHRLPESLVERGELGRRERAPQNGSLNDEPNAE